MASSPNVPIRKSTTVRSYLLRGLEAVAPRSTARWAFEAWCRPMRARQPRAPKGGRAFDLELGTSTLRAWEWGSGETVLLVHGWSSSAAAMEKLVGPLVDAGKHVVAFDLPAHGLSPGEQANLVLLSEAVQAALWRFRPTGVIAHSLGATATALALEGGPPVSRVVLLAPGTRVSYFAHTFAQRVGFSPAIAESILTTIAARVGMNPEALSLVHHAPPVGTSLLLVHDPADEEVPWAHVRELVAAWPGVQFLASLGVGHHRMQRAPSVISAATRFVLQGHVEAPSVQLLDAAA